MSRSDDATKKPGEMRKSRTTRGAGGFRAAAGAAQGQIRVAAGKRGIAETRLLTRWREIVGDDVASATRPVRMKHRTGPALGGILVIAADGARASEIEHLGPTIIERVNAHYGYGAVSQVSFTQATDPLPPMKVRKPKREDAIEALTEDKRRRLDAMTSGVQDSALRGALARLGANVMSRPRKSDDSDA